MSVVRNIVQQDTIALIATANNIVKNCSGTNCNTSDTTFQQIFVQTNTQAQQQAQELRLVLNLQSAESVRGNAITRSYIDLAANVTFAYRYVCGANATKSDDCVLSSTSVQKSQAEIVELGEPAANAELRNFSVYTLLTVVSMLALGLFIIFFIIGIFSRQKSPPSKQIRPPSYTPPPTPPVPSTPRTLQATNPNLVVQPVPTSVPTSY